MAQPSKFKVVRAHLGDKDYAEGDTREGTEADFKHLIPHVLQPIGEAEKAEPMAANKAETPPANKADNRRKSK